MTSRKALSLALIICFLGTLILILGNLYPPTAVFFPSLFRFAKTSVVTEEKNVAITDIRKDAVYGDGKILTMLTAVIPGPSKCVKNVKMEVYVWTGGFNREKIFTGTPIAQDMNNFCQKHADRFYFHHDIFWRGPGYYEFQATPINGDGKPGQVVKTGWMKIE